MHVKHAIFKKMLCRHPNFLLYTLIQNTTNVAAQYIPLILSAVLQPATKLFRATHTIIIVWKIPVKQSRRTGLVECSNLFEGLTTRHSRELYYETHFDYEISY